MDSTRDRQVLKVGEKYILEPGGDDYRRIEPKFQGPRYDFLGDEENENATDSSTEASPAWMTRFSESADVSSVNSSPATTDIWSEGFSVNRHVTALEDALKRRADGEDPFDSAWQQARAIYCRDSSARIWGTFFQGIAVGALRQTALDCVVHLAIHGMENYIQSHASLKPHGRFTPGHGWVLYLLETHLGNMLMDIHRGLPKEGAEPYDEDDNALVMDSVRKLCQAEDQVLDVIKRIGSSREPTQRFQVFDSREGNPVNDEEWGLQRPRHESSTERPTDPDVRTSQDQLYACLMLEIGEKDFPQVALDTSQSDSAALGAGYITWTVTNAGSHRKVLVFSTATGDC